MASRVSHRVVINMSYPVDEFTELVTTLASDLPGLKRTEFADMELLGSAILDQAVKKAIANKLHTYHLMSHRLQQLVTHSGFFLLKNAFSPPVFFSYSGRPLATVIPTTWHPMTNAPVTQQSQSAMSNSTIPVGSKQNCLTVLEASEFGLLVISHPPSLPVLS